MGNRNKLRRSKNPLLVSASGIIRAIDTKEPSRVTVLRLIGDALHAFLESQLVVDEIKARTINYTSRNAHHLSRHQVESDARVRQAHEQGARALFMAASSALIKLPARAGPLRRRAVDLIKITGRAGGPAVVMQAIQNCRSHIAGLKRLAWSESEKGDFEVVCSVLTLAELSNSAIAGRDVAKDSVEFLMGQKVKHKCRRGDLAYAIAMIVQSFPVHAPPDDRMVDNMIDFALSPSAVKHGGCGFGCALLCALVVPLLVSRGHQPADEVIISIERAMKAAPIATERSMWALAMARASVTARRSATYQLKRYGNSQLGTKFPSNSFNRQPMRLERDPDDAIASAWVSNETFEEALEQVAKSAGLHEGRVDAAIAVASVMRMWVQALPENDADIIPLVFSRLLPVLSTIGAVSALVDAIWLGLLKDLKPSRSPMVFEKLLPLLLDDSERNDLRLSALLNVCCTLLFKFGRQAIRESGLTLQYGEIAASLIKRAHEALDISSHYVRLGGVRLICALIMALPRTCSQFVTAVMQNLRIADLTLATHEPSSLGSGTFASVAGIEQELSSILGNAAALAVLIGRIVSDRYSVPAALMRQCKIDSFALLRPHQANPASDAHGLIAGCIRRRAGWGLVGALALAKYEHVFEGDSLTELLCMWKGELGFAGERGSSGSRTAGSHRHSFDSNRPEVNIDQNTGQIDELLATSSTRSAALHALLCALQLCKSENLRQSAKALIGACAARIVTLQAIYGSASSQGVLWGTGGAGWGIDSSDSGADRRQGLSKLTRLLAVESVYLLQCATIVPPQGEVAELCYFIAVSLGEEAEKIAGESENGSVTDTALSNGSVTAERVSPHDAVMANCKPCLSKLMSHKPGLDLSMETARLEKQRNINGSLPDHSDVEGDALWIFSMQGVKPLIAEEVLFHSGAAIAVTVCQDLSASGSLVESLSTCRLSACFSAIIALELSKRLSRSDFEEINRCLALLQVLAKRSLGVTGGCHKAILVENKDGRLFTPHTRGDSQNLVYDDVPGVALQRLAKSSSWMRWARTFSNDGLVSKVPFHDFHTRALGTMHATRYIAADAHRELGITGGPRLWAGMMRRVISVVKENRESLSPSQSIQLSNGLMTMGALLEVIPNPKQGLRENRTEGDDALNADLFIDIDDIGAEAINVLVDIIENGHVDAKESAALALSNSSYRVAESSDRLLAALLKAWTFERGDFSSMGYIGRCATESEVWKSCFSRIWRDMGIRFADNSVRFFSHESSGLGTCPGSIVTGAAAIMSSCRLNWWAISEIGYSTMMELSTELLQWKGSVAGVSRAAGLYGITAMWAAKIDEARVRSLSKGDCSPDVRDFTHGLPFEISLSVPLLPVQAFSLKDPLQMASPVGPFLDEIIYEALAPPERAGVCLELQTAATAAVTEMMRGAGVEAICIHLPRLPEVLLAAVDDGSIEAGRLAMILARFDAQRRPRYWFGLCRAVCLSGDRLNYGTSKSLWDVSAETKTFAVKVAVEAVDRSISSSSCSLQKHDASTKDPKRSSAYGFLRKIFEFVEELCKTGKHDIGACQESCNLVQSIASRIGSASASWDKSDVTLREYRDVWDSCLSVMQGLLGDNVPHTVANNAILAISELLISFLRLHDVNYFKSAQGKVSAFLDNSLRLDLRNRFLYPDQGEEVGVHAMLAFVASYSKVVTTLAALANQKGSGSRTDFPSLQSMRTVFHAIIGDFVCALSGDGLQTTASLGGALTSGMVRECQLESALLTHVPAIVLGAVSCSRDATDGNQRGLEYSWANKNAPGVKLVEEIDRFANVPLACLVWLFKHEKVHMSPMGKRISFDFQSQEALVSVCCTGETLNDQVKELLISFAQWGKEEFLKLAGTVIELELVSADVNIFVISIAQEILRNVVCDEYGAACGDKVKFMCEGMYGLSKAVYTMSKDEKLDVDTVVAQVMDTIASLIQVDTEQAADLYDDIRFQKAVCECVMSCVKACRNQDIVREHWFSKVKEIFQDGYSKGSLARLKVSMTLGAALCDIGDDFDTHVELVQALLAPLPNEKDGELCPLVLDIALECHGIEQFVVQVISGCNPSDPEAMQLSYMLVYELGRLVLSDRPFCVPAVLQISISAIRTDYGKAGVVNRTGLLLYSICLSKLIRSLPSGRGRSLEEQQDIPESAAFLLHLTARDLPMLKSMISLLGSEERDIVKLFLSASEGQQSAS